MRSNSDRAVAAAQGSSCLRTWWLAGLIAVMAGLCSQGAQAADEEWTRCADEATPTQPSFCRFDGGRMVRFGLPGAYVHRFASNGIACTARAFGVSTPAASRRHCEHAALHVDTLKRGQHAKPPLVAATRPPDPAPKPRTGPLSTKKASHTVVDTFFGTDRAQVAAVLPGARYQAGRGELAWGVAHVSIPAIHRMGEIERPLWSRLEWSPDPSLHMMLQDTTALTLDEFRRRVQQSLPGGAEPPRAFVFVHGYNVSFEDAALRTAQIAYDLGMKSVPAFFSWPSQAETSKYTVDEAAVEWAEPHLREFLEAFADAAPWSDVVVIAHSMGTRATTRALASLLEQRTDLRARMRELVLAAPDIDAAVFKRDLLPRLQLANQRVTLYSSSNDKALKASRKVHGAPRAGDSGAQLVTAPGLETVDASDIDTDFLGHSYFAQTRVLLTDMALLVNRRLGAGERPTLVLRGEPEALHWAFRR